MTETTEITNADGTVLRTDGPMTVHQAWVAVMRDVQALGKGEKHDSPGAKFMFRGIDAVMNAVGPALRSHGVVVLPNVTSVGHRDVQTSGGKASRETTVEVEYTIVGPAGDTLRGSAPGEAMDGGDKGTSKAMSVAFRTFLLQSLCLPTDEPDPDSQAHERVAGPTDQERAQDTADRAAKNADPASFPRVIEWAKAQGLDGLMVNVTIDGKPVTGTLKGYLEKRLAELQGPDSDDEAAKLKMLEGSLGAQEIPQGGDGA